MIIKDHDIICLGKDCILIGKLIAWQYYLECLKEKNPWINTLLIVLEFYIGKILGFSELSQRKNKREDDIRKYMLNYINEGVKFHLRKNRSVNDPKPNLRIVQATVEFCVSISMHEFLFSELMSTHS